MAHKKLNPIMVRNRFLNDTKFLNTKKPSIAREPKATKNQGKNSK